MQEAAAYLDYHAHTPLDPDVRQTLFSAFSDLDANPHSQSLQGERARMAVEGARSSIANLIGYAPQDIIFTSGATEANNLAIKGVLGHLKKTGRTRIIVSGGEHASILSTVRALDGEFDVKIAPLLRSGVVDQAALAALLTGETGLVSIAAANHELGTVQPLAEIARLVKSAGAIVHSDLAQAAGKIPLQLADVDMVSVTAHKMHGPIGVGALCARRPIRRLLSPLLNGGGQEGGLRSGTIAAPLAVAFGRACSLAAHRMVSDGQRVSKLRDQLLGLLTASTDVEINGSMEARLPGNLNLRFPGIDGEALVMRVRDEIVISTGSACSSKSLEPSHVLLAIGLSQSQAESAIRIGIGRFTTEAEVIDAANALLRAVSELRAMTGKLRAS
ncbi:cysteine desulfurase family protein [Sinorhizobium meliloti]|uniref:cysteine desulfurase family protein n=1 Tax=Rhizobium meliloti TaxID=382 RepID=UPI000FD80477|nr:cysteine desulfurase family protein [Sinorhizobium meliloti]RVQ56007.1 cysteine desulfurase [Sinorhizobium meliloti]